MPSRPPDKPEYKVYRSRRGLLDRLAGPRDQIAQLREAARRRAQRDAGRGATSRASRGPPKGRSGAASSSGSRSRSARGSCSRSSSSWSARRSPTASPTRPRTRSRAAAACSRAARSSCSAPTSGPRTRSSPEPRARPPAPTASCCCTSASATCGSCRSCATRRPTIPGHGLQKINAAYAFGGAPLMIETVESFLGNGLEINHIIEVSFEDFPDFIDALGGIDVELRGLPALELVRRQAPAAVEGRAPPGRQPGASLRARAEERVRPHRGRPRARRAPAAGDERDPLADRSRRPPSSACRWSAGRRRGRSARDLKGPGLLALFTDLLTGGDRQDARARALQPRRCSPRRRRREAVDELVG